MTEFEIASLAFQEMSAWAGVGSAIAAIVAASGIWWGIAAMMRANKQRAAILDQQREADERRHAEAMEEGRRRHAETMEEGRRRHAETMAVLDRQRLADDKRHLEAMAALAEQSRTLEAVVRGLETVIERTAPDAAKKDT